MPSLTKPRLIALWVCFGYFCAVWLLHLGGWIWGTLGLIRPGDTVDGMVHREQAEAIISLIHGRFNSLFGWLTLGVVLFAAVLVWCSVPFRTGSQEQNPK